MPEPSGIAPSHPTRRTFIALGVGAFVVATLPFARRRPGLIQRRLPVMGTIGEIAVVHRDPRFAHAAIDAAFSRLLEVERLMTRFRPESDIGRANASAARDGVPVSAATAHVVEQALWWAERSAGAFDPAVGRLVELWDVTERKTPPSPAAYRRLAGRRLYRAVDVSRAGVRSVLRFTEPDVALDLGGIAKGYGVDRAVAALRDAGIRHGLVNVGGDLYALGRSPEGDPWRVGIRSPSDPQTLVGRIAVADAAVATSGDYLRYFEHRGQRYHHLLDPATGAPRASATRSLTVRASTCIEADAAATAAFGLPVARGVALLRRAAPAAQVVSATA